MKKDYNDCMVNNQMTAKKLLRSNVMVMSSRRHREMSGLQGMYASSD